MVTKFTNAYKICFTVAVASMSAPGLGYATSFDYGGKAGFEHFQWEEIETDGSRLLKESGSRSVISGFLGNTLRSNKQFIYRAEAKVYFGTVNYDGATIATPGNPSVPVQSDTSYTGFNAQGEAGFREEIADSSMAWDFVGRAGIDNWLREIASSTDNTGRPVSGAREQYTILNLRIGTGPSWQSNHWQGRLIAGLKYPIWTDEYIKKEDSGFDSDLYLEPKGRPSAFLNFYNYVRLSKRFWLTFDAFYDSYRFDKSDNVAASIGSALYSVWQPESRQDNYGLQAGIVVSY